MKNTNILTDLHVSITSSSLMKHVNYLASDYMRGRMPGDIGYQRAVEYVEGCLTELDLKPAFSDNAYRQAFQIETCCIHEPTVKLTSIIGGQRVLELGRDYVCRGLTGDADISGELVFVGYCSTDDTLNELDDIDLDGKIAVSFKHPPPWAEKGETLLPREKAHILKQRGAKGLLIVPNPNRSYPDRLSVSMVEKGEYIPGFPLLVISEQLANELLCFDQKTLSSRQYELDQKRRVQSGTVPASIDIKLTTDHDPDGVTWNVGAVLPGTDPALAHETVVVGAHLDHVGIQGDVIFNGAQDNASGVASVLEIARVLKQQTRLRRSVEFVFFGAEEAGLFGSMHYVDNYAGGISNIKAMLNLDCMGAGSGLDMHGRPAYPELFEILDRLNKEYVNINDVRKDHPAGGADAKPFEDKGVPNMYFVSSDAYRHLHMSSDKDDTVNPALLTDITRLAALVTAEIASQE